MISSPEIQPPGFYTLPEVAKLLRKSPRWLSEWLRRHPTDHHAAPFYTPMGRKKIFEANDVSRIFAAAREIEQCRLNSFRHAKARPLIGQSAARTSDDMWIEARRLLSDPLPKRCGPNESGK